MIKPYCLFTEESNVQIKSGNLFATLFLLITCSTLFQGVYAQQTGNTALTLNSGVSRKAAENITAEQLKGYLNFIASDEMEGRDTPSRGLDTVAKFIALNLSRWGFKPAGDNNTYFQRIDLRHESLNFAETSAEIDGQVFKPGIDFIAFPGPTNSVADSSTAPLVYVGEGWVVTAKNINPYTGIDVKDKIMVVSGGAGFPKGVTRSDLRGPDGGEQWASPAGYAQAHGAKGVIWIPDYSYLMQWDEVQRAVLKGRAVVDKLQSSTRFGVPRIALSPRMASALFEGQKYNAETIVNSDVKGVKIEPFFFTTDKKVSFKVSSIFKRQSTQNVVGVFEGSDPILKNEFVALGAHYDHVGANASSSLNRDVIFNGADDDGSGTVAILSIAEALSKSSSARPKRSILFVWHAGEEKGLWGSSYFVKFPTIALNKIAAQLNLDMIGRSKILGDSNPLNKDLTGSDEVYVVGSKMLSSELGQLSETVNDSYLKLRFNYRYDDPTDPERIFYRSDHYNYARNGIPIIFYYSGTHEDYHEPGDEPQKIDYQKMEKITRTVFLTMWEVANLPTKPRVDKPTPAQLVP